MQCFYFPNNSFGILCKLSDLHEMCFCCCFFSLKNIVVNILCKFKEICAMGTVNVLKFQTLSTPQKLLNHAPVHHH